MAAVRQAAKTDDVVAVYLHWGEENVGCPTADQLDLAADLAAAGADVVVGAHAHQPQGAGLLGDTYVSYGLGNFLWYHGNQSETGVLRRDAARRWRRRRRVGPRRDPRGGRPPAP